MDTLRRWLLASFATSILIVVSFFYIDRPLARLMAEFHLLQAANGRGDGEDYSGAHAQDSHAPPQTGIPNGIHMSDFIH